MIEIAMILGGLFGVRIAWITRQDLLMLDLIHRFNNDAIQQSQYELAERGLVLYKLLDESFWSRVLDLRRWTTKQIYREIAAEMRELT